MALLAGWYFRRTARHPGPGEEGYVELCEGLYHFGVVMAIWCAALLVPWFRNPFFTLIALGLPVAYFYIRAELATRAGKTEARRYRNSAAVLGFIILALYVFKGAFHLILFPGTPVSTEYYHFNAPLIVVLGLVLLRLHGLGGTTWLAFYGGIALMTGSYFWLTWLPGFSPFEYAMPSAWCAIGLGHFWILLSYARSPLRTLIQRIANLNDDSWHSLWLNWGRCLLAATQTATFFGIGDYASDTYMVAPLLAGAATIFIHQGIIRMLRSNASSAPIGLAENLSPTSTPKGARRGVAYLILGSLELLAALHMGFLIPSYLDKHYVIWAILGLWLAMLVVHQFLPRKPDFEIETIGRIALVFAALTLAHIFYHRPWTATGLWAMALGGIVAALNPVHSFSLARRSAFDEDGSSVQATAPVASNALAQFCAGLLLLIPAWLVYFSQVHATGYDLSLEEALQPWPILATTAAMFLTGLFARLFPERLAPGYIRWRRTQFRLFDLTLSRIQTSGARIHFVALVLTLIICFTTQLAHYGAAFSGREVALLILLEAAFAVAWFYEGKRRQSMVAYYLMQISAVACFAALRRHLMLTTNFWTYEYDVWASLAFSLVLSGAKQVFDLQPRSLRVPLLTTMFALPAMALVWVIVHGLGVNMALLVVGLHSVLFAYLGRESRESPYNILALSGFVAFILMVFYSKFHLRAVHAYIIPVGLGVLVLQEIFRDRIKPDARNWIRLVTLMAMLGSSGYYALVDPRYPITFNLTMILLCLLGMGLGSFLRIRVYLAMSFAGLMVDLISILYKVLVQMERSARMTIIGSLVLVIGAILVFGAIYYKTNKAKFDAWVESWRARLAKWQ
jgi:hypothetical protein